MKKFLLAALVLFAFPGLTMAQTATTIPLSDQFTQDVQSSCIDLKYNLSYRSRDARTNDEVSLLQDFLIARGYLSGESTGYFGVATLAAVKEFQLELGVGSPTTPGYGGVGPKSRAKIKALTCVSGGMTEATPATSITPTPTVLAVPGCLAGYAFSPVTGQSCSTTPVATISVQSIATQLPAPSINVNTTASTTITLLYPNGGETVVSTDTLSVTWSTMNFGSDKQISVGLYGPYQGSVPSAQYNLGNIQNNGNHTFSLPTSLMPGLYKISVGTIYPSVNPEQAANDSSDNYFTINTSAPSTTTTTATTTPVSSPAKTDLDLFKDCIYQSTATSPSCAKADFNKDGLVNVADLAEMKSALKYDLNGDNTVDLTDSSINADSNFLKGCFYKTIISLPECVKADFNKDGLVNTLDLGLFKSAIKYDLSGDSKVTYGATTTTTPVLTPVKVLSPNGGETFNAGGNMTVSWSGESDASVIDVSVFPWAAQMDTTKSYTAIASARTQQNTKSATLTLPAFLAAGQYFVRLICMSACAPAPRSAFDDSDAPFSVTAVAVTVPTVEVIGIPTMSLQYDSAQKEVALVANYVVKITAGSQALSFLPYYTNCGGGTPVYFSMLSTTGQGARLLTCAMGPVTIPSGTSATYTIKLTANPNQIFAGAYTATLEPGIASLDSAGQWMTTSLPTPKYIGILKTNTVTVIGERAPYLDPVYGGYSYPLDRVSTILGSRLTQTSNTVSLGGVSKIIPATVVSTGLWAIGIKPADFGITTAGVYQLQISTAEGASNSISFNVTPASAPAALPPTLSVAIDSSSPSYSIAAAGTNGKVVGVYRLRATNESINLNRLGLVLTNGNPSDLVNVTVWDGVTQAGTGYFIGTNTHAVVNFISPIVIAKDTDKTLTIKADLMPQGVGYAGAAGTLVAIDIDGANTQGVGATSGVSVVATGSTAVSGVRVYKSYPIIALDTLPSSGIADGKLLRFKVAANTSGSISLNKLDFYASATGATVQGVNLFAYTDSSYTTPVSGFSAGQLALANVSLLPWGTIAFSAPLVISAGVTYYFELRGTVAQATTGSSVQASMGMDYASTPIAPAAAVSGHIVWSPNTMTASAVSATDWTNGYGILTQSPTQIRVATASASRSSQLASVIDALGSSARTNTSASTAPQVPSFTYKWVHDLEIGSSYPNDVAALQTALVKQGMFIGETSGGFYDKTFVAVKAFQTKYGVESTGFVGPQTRAKLNELYR